jgi:meso-butanediol dehydrogenase / (S,S)-butanediol dehydrogenase / diacetyl reductase
MNSRVAIVTGAGSGIGRASAIALADDGYAVALLDVRANALEETVSLLDGKAFLCATVDVSHADEVDRAVAETARKFGRLDVAVSAAGIIQVRPFLDLTGTDWDHVVSVNLKGTFHLGQAVARVMVRAGAGSIVNIASTAGKIGRPLSAHYSASKFGVIGLSQSMALALAGDGVRVNAVCPGIIDTPMWTAIDAELTRMSGRDPGEAREAQIADVPLGRAGSAQEVADLVLFLAGDRARYITGQAINISGGLVTH